MLWRAVLGVTCIFGLGLFNSSVFAQGLLPAATVSSSGMFFSADVDYRSIKTPTYSLGAHSVDLGTGGDAGAVNITKPRVSGAGGQATLGYFLPSGTHPAALGNARIALSGGYFSADSRQNATYTDPFLVWVLLDGTVAPACGCMSSLLETKQSGWRFGLSAAADVTNSHAIWSPFAEIVAASTRTKQALTQVDSLGTYAANTRLSWNDVGVKFGLMTSLPITPMFEWGLGGSLSILYRRADFSGDDSYQDNFITVTSLANIEANTWAFVPALQTQVTIRPAANLQLRIFGAMEWDNRVPQIIAPTFSFFAFQGDPVRLGFASQTSHRIGGSLIYAFN